MYSVQCANGQSQFNCCGGSSGNEIFTGLTVLDSSAVIARIYAPFEAFVGVLTEHVYLSDYKGNRFTINLSETVYSTLDELVSAVAKCKTATCDCDGAAACNDVPTQDCITERFLNVTGSQVVLTTPLPAGAEIPARVFVNRGGKKSIFETDFLLNAGLNALSFSTPLDGENVEVTICQQSDWQTANFLNATGATIDLSELSISLLKCSLEKEQFLNVSRGFIQLQGPFFLEEQLTSLEVYRDGRLGFQGYDYTVDFETKRINFTRALEGEDIEVFYRGAYYPDSMLRVYRAGLKSIINHHFTYSSATGLLNYQRVLENENVQVLYRSST